MRLEHYSNYPLGQLRAAEQSRIPSNKPQGLWLSVKGQRDWLSFALRLENLQGTLSHCAVFRLVEGANVLHLTTAAEIDTFHKLYSAETNPAMPEHREIAWQLVAAKFDGIIIAPFQPSRRLDRRSSWYFGWDCASACLWNPRAIERIDR